ncbi:MAG: MarR family transcriptional regulator [Acidobacteria bacterium]|nr:MarR family transcriptional regulator [Acidobacteriota bacterium]
MRKQARTIRLASGRVTVADRLHSAAIHLLRGVRKQDAATGLGPAQLSALSVVVFAGPLTLGELAAAEQVKAPTMTRIVAALEQNGLVARRVDSEDRRVVHLRATAKGARVLHQARRRRIRTLAARLRSLDARQLATLNRAAYLLERLFHRAR